MTVAADVVLRWTDDSLSLTGWGWFAIFGFALLLSNPWRNS